MKLHSLIAAALLSVTGHGQAGLIHQYELTGNLKDEKGGADLALFVNGPVGPSAYAFSQNKGLKLQYALGPVYTIDMAFRLSAVTNGYQRLLDFQAPLNKDHGMYVHQDDFCYYNGGCNGAGTFRPNQDIRLTVTRDAASRVTIYQNGQSVFSFVDSTGQASPTGERRLSFFRDDGSEWSAGSVDFIHLYDHALDQQEVLALGPVGVAEPASLGLVGAGLALVGWTRRRKPHGTA